MPLKRRHVRIPAAIALVALAAFSVLWLGARTQMARSLVAGWVTDTTGLPATIEGLRIGFIPSPMLEIGGLAIDQPAGFDGAPLVEARHLRLSLPWRGLFDATSLRAVAVSGATLRLVVGADGIANWSQLLPETAPGAAPAEAPAWSLGKLEFEGGTLDYRDLAADARWQLTAITVTASDLAPAVEFPLELQLGGVFGPNTLHYAMKGRARLDTATGRYEAGALEMRGWAGGDPLPLAGVEFAGGLERASFERDSGAAVLEAGRFTLAGIPGTFDGTLDFGQPTIVADLRLATAPFAPRAPAIIFGQPLPVTADPAAFQSLQLVLEARLRDGELQLDPVTGRLDDTNFEGRVVPGRRFVRASLDRIDLNRYLPPAVKSVRGKKATLEAAVAELAEYDLDAEIRIAEARVAGASLRDTVIRVERGGEHSP